MALDLGEAVGQIKVEKVGFGDGEAQEHPLHGLCTIVTCMATKLILGSLDVGFVMGATTMVSSF